MEKLNNFFFGGQPSKSDSIIFYSFLFGGSALSIFIWVVNAFV